MQNEKCKVGNAGCRVALAKCPQFGNSGTMRPFLGTARIKPRRIELIS